MQRKQQGFTLIELVIVIVILGVLSAFALPRFANLGENAREATIKGALGSVLAAAAIARSQVLAQGANEGADAEDPDFINMDGSDVTLSSNGYPSADADGIGKAAQLSDDFVFEGADIRLSAASDPALCAFTYDDEDGTATKVAGFEC